MDVLEFNQSAIDGHIGCFQIFAITNSASVNNVILPVGVCVCGTAISKSIFICNFDTY